MIVRASFPSRQTGEIYHIIDSYGDDVKHSRSRFNQVSRFQTLCAYKVDVIYVSQDMRAEIFCEDSSLSPLGIDFAHVGCQHLLRYTAGTASAKLW